MELNWLGRYRPLMEKMIKYANTYARTYTKQQHYGTAVSFSAAEIQTLEYILENEDKHQNMASVAARLGVSPSAFSKNIKVMLGKGLLEKYHTSNNRKNIIIRATQLGRDTYGDYCRYVQKDFTNEMFSKLKDISNEDLEKLAEVFDKLADSLVSQQTDEVSDADLIKIGN